MDWEVQGHRVHWAHDAACPEDITPPIDENRQPIPDRPNLLADFCFCLSYGRIVSTATRARFRHTLVVHESDLPRGKGWSPLTWQILEGQQRIPVTLFEAAEQVDSGAIYSQRWLDFQGHELVDELRAEQAEATFNLCRWFVDEYPASAEQARPQSGQQTFYPRRRPEDSRLDPKQTIAEQFNLLRVVDNERYPAFFDYHGERYRIRVAKQ